MALPLLSPMSLQSVWIKMYIYRIIWIIALINILQFIFIDSAKTGGWNMATFFKLPFWILKMSEWDLASSITPQTTLILSKSTKQLLNYCPYTWLMLINANYANYANCPTYAGLANRLCSQCSCSCVETLVILRAKLHFVLSLLSVLKMAILMRAY